MKRRDFISKGIGAGVVAGAASIPLVSHGVDATTAATEPVVAKKTSKSSTKWLFTPLPIWGVGIKIAR